MERKMRRKRQKIRSANEMTEKGKRGWEMKRRKK